VVIYIKDERIGKVDQKHSNQKQGTKKQRREYRNRPGTSDTKDDANEKRKWGGVINRKRENETTLKTNRRNPAKQNRLDALP